MSVMMPSGATEEAAGAALREADLSTAAMTALSELVGRAATWSPDERRALLRRLDRTIDGLSAVRAVVLVAERESGAWQGSGDRSFEAWRGRTGGSGERSATAQVRQAEQLVGVPAAAEAVTAGRISLEHAAVIARVAGTGTPVQQEVASSEAGQAELLGLAQRLDAGTFAGAVARWAATVDPEALERDHQAQRRERFFHLADTPRGTLVKGLVDRMAGHRLRLALEALSPRPAADDDRDAGQRCADALDDMATRTLAAVDTKPGGHVPPQVSLILTAETWAAARAERDRRRAAAQAEGSAGAGDGWGVGTAAGLGSRGASGSSATASASSPVGAIEPSVQNPPATLEDGTPVPATELARLLCDCDLTRVVIDAEGVPTDLGRTQRLYTREQRRAVIARDRECIWPDCHRHARWCEIHHLRWWERDAGPTSLDNGALLCGFHHHEVHRRNLTIARLSPGPGRTPAARGRPRGIGRVAYEFRDPTGRVVVATGAWVTADVSARPPGGAISRPIGGGGTGGVGVPRGPGGAGVPRGPGGEKVPPEPGGAGVPREPGGAGAPRDVGRAPTPSTPASTLQMVEPWERAPVS